MATTTDPPLPPLQTMLVTKVRKESLVVIGIVSDNIAELAVAEAKFSKDIAYSLCNIDTSMSSLLSRYG